MSRNRNKRLHLLAILSCNLSLLLLGVLVLELIFGRWFRGNNALWRLNIQRDAEVVLGVSDLYPSETGFARYKVDENGFRGPFKNLADLDLLTIGGSTTAQSEISDGKTWQDVVAREFEKDGVKIQIANAGIDGQSVYGNVRNFKLWFRYVPNLRPKYILGYEGINDFCLDHRFYQDYLVEVPTWKTYIKKRSAVYFLYRVARGMFLYYTNPRHDTFVHLPDRGKTDEPLIQDHAVWAEPRLKAYERRLKLLLKRIREFGAVPILMTQRMSSSWLEEGKRMGIKEPYKCVDREVNGLDEYYTLSLFNERLLKVCREEKILCFDLATEIDFTREDFFDDMHNTPFGSEKVGKYVYQKLKQAEIFHGEDA